MHARWISSMLVEFKLVALQLHTHYRLAIQDQILTSWEFASAVGGAVADDLKIPRSQKKLWPWSFETSVCRCSLACLPHQLAGRKWLSIIVSRFLPESWRRNWKIDVSLRCFPGIIIFPSEILLSIARFPVWCGGIIPLRAGQWSLGLRSLQIKTFVVWDHESDWGSLRHLWRAGRLGFQQQSRQGQH